MNNIHLLPKKNQGYFLALLIALFFVSVLSSCKKNDDEVGQPDVSYITFIHSAPQYQFTPLDFYIGGVRTTPALQYTETSARYASGPYLGLYSGVYYVQVGIGGTTQQLLAGNLNFKANESYSFFVTTKSPTVDTADAIIITDNLSAPSSGKAKVRFVNVSKSATALDLAVQNGATLFSNKAYNSYTDFIEVTPGTLTFQAKETGTSTVRASQSVNVEGGKIYTLWASGSPSGTGSGGFGLQYMANK